ncbi:MAG: hypothetical protein IJ660_00350 [Alphaproteobacteria bacterium]|nr:hypothetical protein [Alphaproteobacteria bacterium]
MKPKLLTKRQQLGIFNCADPIAVMREYVSYSKDVLFVARKRMFTSSLEEFIQYCKDEADRKEFIKRYDDENQTIYIEDFIRQCKAERAKKIAAGECEERNPITETQKQMFLNLSEKDANEIYFNIDGYIYPEVLIKMLDTFPKEVSKELLLEYAKYCNLSDEVGIRAISVLGKDAKEIILQIKYLNIGVFNKIFRVFGKEETKKIVIELAKNDFDIDDQVETKILHLYSASDLKELLKAFIENSTSINGKLFSKIFDVCSTKEEIEKLLDLALENDMDLWHETLDKIVEYFPKEKAKTYLDRFFTETGPGRGEYDDETKEEYYNLLLTEEERELEDK